MKDKLIYFIMGVQGSGKTTLANQLAKKCKSSLVFEDHEYIASNKERIKRMWEMKKEMSAARHIQKNIFVVTGSPRFLDNECDVRNDHHITWVLTGITPLLKDDLQKFALNHWHLKKLYNGWINYVKMKRKTRPYLTITRKSPLGKTLIYKHHRFKK